MKHRDATRHAQDHTSNRWSKQDSNSGNLAWECVLYFCLFIGCAASSLLCTGFLQLWRVGITLHCIRRASLAVAHRLEDLWASVAAAHRLVALRHMESSWNKDRICMPCIDRQVRIHWATREVHAHAFLKQNEDPMICSFFFWLFSFFTS